MRNSRKWFIWGAVVVVFGFFGAVVLAAYMERFGGNSDPILVRAPATPLKRLPDDPGGLAVANESSNVVAALDGDDEPPQPERILPRELPSIVDDPLPEIDLPADETELALEVPDEPETSETIAPATVQPAPAIEAQTPPEEIEELEAVDDVPAPRPLPEPAPVRAEPEPLPEPEPVTQPEPEPVVEPQPVAEPELPSEPEPQPEPAPEPQIAAVQPSEPAAPNAEPSGEIGFRLQLGAFGSDIAARLAWAAYRERFGEVIAGLSPHIARSSGADPIFRLQAGPFPSRDSASSVCDSVKERGGDCFVVAAN